VKAGKGGIVTMAVADGSEIQAGDPIVEYQGIAPLRKRLGDDAGGLIWDVETRYPKEIEAATKKRDAALAANNKAAAKQHEAKIKERTERLEEQTKVADELRAKIDEHMVTAPVAGTVVGPVKKGKRVGADDVIAKIETGQALVATFDVPEKAPAVDASVGLTAKDAPDQKANCTVTKVVGTQVTVTCPLDGPLADGTVVVLEQP
jgi:biotin carboxyl carrier protein